MKCRRGAVELLACFLGLFSFQFRFVKRERILICSYHPIRNVYRVIN